MKQSLSSAQRRLMTILCFLAIPISGLATDIYTPSLPALTDYFATTSTLVKWTVSIYLLGLGSTQLISGRITDSFGRRRPILFGMIAFMMFSFAIPYSSNIYIFLFFRFLLGVSFAFSSVALRAMIADLYHGDEFRKMTTYMTTVWAIGPIIAPFIGGYLQHYFGWQANFYSLAFYTLLVTLPMLFLLKETSAHLHRLHLGQALKDYATIITHREFIGGVFCVGSLYSLLLIFAVISPYLVQEVLHHSPIVYGKVALLMGFAWFLGTVTNRLIFSIPERIKIPIALSGGILATVVMSLNGLLFDLSLLTLVIPMFIVTYCGGVVFPIYFANSITHFPTLAGSANALLSAVMMMTVSFVASLASLLHSQSQIPLALCCMSLFVICFTLYYFLLRQSAR